MLYIVSTPIGNLKDISPRALEILKGVNFIFAESPSDSLRLLNSFEIKGKKIIKYNDRSKKEMESKILPILKENDACYISSAGTPGISDPGADLVNFTRLNGILVRIIPGPSALVSAIAGSGIRARQFTFVSFPPKKQGQLKKLFSEYKEKKEVLVFFESTYRIEKTLNILNEAAPECRVCLAKEITKIFENYLVGVPEEILKQLKDDLKLLKGEFVFVIEF